MRQRLTRISKLLNQAERWMGKSAMHEALQRFYDTGEKPTSEPAASFVNLLESFDRMIDASVGGGDYDAARVAYETAVKRWQKAEKGA
ncbi:MAG: hypothetical protein RBS72_20595 [Sedimentisphaerales bacterium]|jgi:hypothetical protein|nr:hypothetical protein [Sedimentisphaerales bacterium]HNY81074.1 hypothetical protein [Sedimentisphaerales bacterium]